ncbi:MAG: hypothetical protein QOJ69_1604 [Actinomycetota bacterium]|nr:hypothetical protein [Actinomycetota bacterium]
MARTALSLGGDTRFATAVLADVLLRRCEYDSALAVLSAARSQFRGIPWYDLTFADALLEAGRVEEAEQVLEDVVERPTLRRHALKRLSRLALDRGDRVRARGFFEELVALAPDYLVYASDYEILGDLQLEAGDADAAEATWRKGAEIYPRHLPLATRLREHCGVTAPSRPPRIPAVMEIDLGVRRIPVRTRFITWRVGLAETIEEAIVGLRQPGDVIALSESAAAAGQGRVLPLELVQPGRLARFLCPFVGKAGPLHSPAGMPGAIMVCGTGRVVAGAVAGAVGKAAGRQGWFYRVAGPQAAMIDDVAACLPPHDHHLIFGPRDPDGLARRLATALHGKVAIVDANHSSGAWVVGASYGVDREWLCRALADNPAGNEDEQTPVVLVRRVMA